MKFLENRILRDARVLANDVLMTDKIMGGLSDIETLSQTADEICRRFADCRISKVVCTQDSGQIVAAFAAKNLEVPLIVAKKSPGDVNLSEVYAGKVVSFTKNEVFDLFIPREYVKREDTVLIVIDVISRGNEAIAVLDILKQAGCTVCGIGCAIEKTFLRGGDAIRGTGVRLESVARIESMSTSNGIRFLSD